MSKAPNETDESYKRKNELFALRDQRQLTMDELLELRNLTHIAISHMSYKPLGK